MVFWAFLLVITVLPVKFKLVLSNSNRPCLEIHASYAWGIARYYYSREIESSSITASLLGVRIYSRVGSTADRGKKDKGIAGGGKSPSRGKKYVRFLLRAGKGVYGTVAAKSFQGKLRIGLGDPAYTGMLCGMLYCIPAFLNGSVEFQPDFAGKALEVDLHFEGILIPAAAAAAVLKVSAGIAKERLLCRPYLKHSPL